MGIHDRLTQTLPLTRKELRGEWEFLLQNAALNVEMWVEERAFSSKTGTRRRLLSSSDCMQKDRIFTLRNTLRDFLRATRGRLECLSPPDTSHCTTTPEFYLLSV